MILPLDTHAHIEPDIAPENSSPCARASSRSRARLVSTRQRGHDPTHPSYGVRDAIRD